MSNVSPFIPPEEVERQDVSRDYERAVLGALIVNPDEYEAIASVLTPEDFRWPDLANVYRAIHTTRAAGQPIDLLVIKEQMIEDGTFEANGAEGLTRLIEGVPRSAHGLAYAEKVRDAARARRFRNSAEAAVWAMQDTEPARAREHLEDAFDELDDRGDVTAPTDLYGTTVRPRRPEFIVSNLIRKSGISMIWAQPGGHKTSLTLRIVNELMAPNMFDRLLGHPDLTIDHRPQSVLLITTEEDTEDLRFVADAVLRGMGNPEIAGKLTHLYAHQGHRRLTLDDLPEIIRRHGPFQMIVLDSLTGLRPKVVDGVRVRYDADNDTANDLMLAVRGLAAEHQIAFIVLHHSDKLVKNYRGPVEYWASTDTMFGLLKDGSRIKVDHQKTRGGRVLPAFMLTPEWDGDTLTFSYDGEATEGDNDLKPATRRILDLLTGAGRASQNFIHTQTGLHRDTIRTSLRELADRELAEDTGEKDNRSPIWQRTEPAMPQVPNAGFSTTQGK